MRGDENHRQACIDVVNFAECLETALRGELEDEHINVVVSDRASHVTDVFAGKSLPSCGSRDGCVGATGPGIVVNDENLQAFFRVHKCKPRLCGIPYIVWDSRQYANARFVCLLVFMEDPRNIVAPQVIRLRTERGWSQSDFAAACQRIGWDVSRGVIARIEGGVRWVADAELLQLARVLAVPVPELFPPRDRHLFVRESRKR